MESFAEHREWVLAHTRDHLIGLCLCDFAACHLLLEMRFEYGERFCLELVRS